MNRNSKCEKVETWKYQAFIAAYSRLSLALMFSLVIPIVSLFIIYLTTNISVKSGATYARDWIRMGLTLVPHFVISVAILGLTPSLSRPLPYRQNWSGLAELTKGLAKDSICLFAVISFATIVELAFFTDYGKDATDNYDECRRIVGVLVNWISSLILTLLIVRVNCDQTRVALSLEALDILEWNGLKDGQCNVEVTNAVKKSFRAQMEKIHEFLCLGTTVADMAFGYLSFMSCLVFIILFNSFIKLCFDFSGTHFLIFVCSAVHFVQYACAGAEMEMKIKVSLSILAVLFAQLFVAGFLTYQFFYDRTLMEFVLRSIRYWNGDSQPASVPGTFWAEESAINDPKWMVFNSMGVMVLSTFYVILLHSIYSLVLYVISKSPADSAKNEDAKEIIV